MRVAIVILGILLFGCNKKPAETQINSPAMEVKLHPDYSVIESHYQMTKDWTVTLPSKFNRRMEDGELVIWKPGFTIWVSVWGNDKSESQSQRLSSTKEDSSPESFDTVTESSDGVTRYSYRLREESEDDRQPAFYGFVFGDTGHVQIAMYIDSERDLEEAIAIWRSIVESNKSG